jgi:TonB family protein
MKTHLLGLTAAALLVAAGTASAADSQLQAFFADAQAKATSQLAHAGVDLAGQGVRVKAHVDSEGELSNVHVVSSTASRDVDYNVETALRRVRLAYVPPQLIGSDVTLALGQAPLVQAKAR